MPIPWNDDDPRDLPLIDESLRSVLREIVESSTRRALPTVSMAKDWHRRVFQGARPPVSYYAGGIRGSDPGLAELYGYEVVVGPLRGVPSQEVPAQLARFEASMQQAVSRLDPLIPPAEPPVDNDQLRAVLTLAAHAHGEWVRIHPFANGNGRVGRLWGNWCAVRYGLPPFVRLQPRPEGSRYASAAAESMRGDHRPMIAEFARTLARRLAEGPIAPRRDT